jgi:NAD(P)H-hydrate repair Nnr-like enzyme with NAD(P)H-hydrate dehydratase domain
VAIEVRPERTREALKALVPFPSPECNKYTRGHLFMVVGSATYPGAAILSAHASTLTGTGYTEVYCAPRTMPLAQAALPSVVVRDWKGWKPAKLPLLRAGHPRACVIGCGFNDAERFVTQLVLETLRTFEGPLLVDGGALTVLATPAGLALAQTRNPHTLVLTPHEGEAMRLAHGANLGSSLTGPELAAALCETYHATVVLKGPTTYIATANKETTNNAPINEPSSPVEAPTEETCDTQASVLDELTETKLLKQALHVEEMTRGTAALAKAGTGDVLAGIIGSLLSQGLAPADAAALGSALHAEAGNTAARDIGIISVTAEEVVKYLPRAFEYVGH